MLEISTQKEWFISAESLMSDMDQEKKSLSLFKSLKVLLEHSNALVKIMMKFVSTFSASFHEEKNLL